MGFFKGVKQAVDKIKANPKSAASTVQELKKTTPKGMLGSVVSAARRATPSMDEAKKTAPKRGLFAAVRQQVEAVKAGNAPVRKVKKGMFGRLAQQVAAAKKAAPMTPLAAKKGGAITKGRAKSMSTKRGK